MRKYANRVIFFFARGSVVVVETGLSSVVGVKVNGCRTE